MLVNVTKIPKKVLAVLVAGIALLGAYAYSNSLYPVWIMLISGIIGYLFRKVGIPTTPIVLAMVLGFMMEVNLRRGLIVSKGNLMFIFERPITIVLLILALITLFLPLFKNIFDKMKVQKL